MHMETDAISRFAAPDDLCTSSTKQSNAPKKIILHIYDDQSREFTSLTTYHGMVRIYNSNNWASLIFWCLVVITCLSLFMIHSGYLLNMYMLKPNFLDTKHLKREVSSSAFPTTSICFDTRGTNTTLPENGMNDVFLTEKGKNNSQLISCFTNAKIGCCKFSHDDLYRKSRMTVVMNTTNFDGEVIVNFQPQNTHTVIPNHGLHLSTGSHTRFFLNTIKQTLVTQNEGGSCQSSARLSVTDCQFDCLRRHVLAACSCLPDLFSHSRARHITCKKEYDVLCALREMKNPPRCSCGTPCDRILYPVRQTSMSSLYSRNQTVVTIILRVENMLHQLQRRRLSTVQVLCFVAGSMGLFLGMSCVTLLEIFIYLFKSFWINTSSSRHHAYINRVLGGSVDNINTLSQRNVIYRAHSHDEIIVTQNNNLHLTDIDLPTLRIQRSSTFYG